MGPCTAFAPDVKIEGHPFPIESSPEKVVTAGRPAPLTRGGADQTRAGSALALASGTVVRQVNRLFGEGTVAGLTESQLLERFAARRDEAAFEALVARHGPMVLSVCRGTLRDPNDADDAFQATFLILAKKAATIRAGERLGAWLHRVARRVSVRASVETVHRRSKERPEVVESTAPGEDHERQELRRLVHEEVDRLPESYRLAVLLCDLEGQTHEEAARRLNWPVGTVKGRLFRARGRLRDRLIRRGIAAPVALAAAGLATSEAGAALIASVVSDGLREITVRAASAFAAGRSAIAGGLAPGGLALAEGVLAMMFRNQLRATGMALSTTALLAAGLGGLALAQQKAEEPGGRGAKAVASAKDDAAADLKALQGTWEAVAHQDAGHEEVTDIYGKMTIRGDQIRTGSPNEWTARLSLATGDGPNGLEWTVPEGEDGGKVERAIYRLDGDRLTIAYAKPGDPRPTSFDPGPGGAQHRTVWRKVEAPEKPRSAAAAAADPKAEAKPQPPDSRKLILGDWQLQSIEGQLPPYQPQTMTVTPEAMTWVLGYNGPNNEHAITLTYSYKLGEGTPLPIDVTADKGKEKGRLRLGIIEAGDENLSLVLAAGLREPPPPLLQREPERPRPRRAGRPAQTHPAPLDEPDPFQPPESRRRNDERPAEGAATRPLVGRGGRGGRRGPGPAE